MRMGEVPLPLSAIYLVLWHALAKCIRCYIKIFMAADLSVKLVKNCTMQKFPAIRYKYDNHRCYDLCTCMYRRLFVHVHVKYMSLHVHVCSTEHIEWYIARGLSNYQAFRKQVSLHMLYNE